jgi:hypothetical protein
MTTTASLYRKEVVYDRTTRDYAEYLDGELVGFAKTYHAAEVALDQLVFDLQHSGLTTPASALDGGLPEWEAVTPIEPSEPPVDAYHAFVAADDAWQAELERLFGWRAGDVRYTTAGRTGPTLAPLYAEFRRTCNAWYAAPAAACSPRLMPAAVPIDEQIRRTALLLTERGSDGVLKGRVCSC